MDGRPAGQLSDHVPRMYRVALRIVGDLDEAQDIVQDACVKALRRMGSFDGRAALATWLHRITVNCARDHLRAQRRAVRNGVSMNDEIAGMLTATQLLPSDKAERRELHDIASTLVKSLPDDCRIAFTLTQLDGYSYDEAAIIEDQPRGTMASRVFRAKKILLEQMNARIDGRAQS